MGFLKIFTSLKIFRFLKIFTRYPTRARARTMSNPSWQTSLENFYKSQDFQILENFYKSQDFQILENFYKVPHARARAQCPIRPGKLLLKIFTSLKIFRFLKIFTSLKTRARACTMSNPSW